MRVCEEIMARFNLKLLISILGLPRSLLLMYIFIYERESVTRRIWLFIPEKKQANHKNMMMDSKAPSSSRIFLDISRR